MVEILGYNNFDFGIIDMEHGSFGIDTVHKLVRAADASEMVSIIRVPANEEGHISKALDTGASGVVIPGISCVEDVEKAIKYSKYYPLGTRGACPCVRANSYGAENIKFYTKSNEDTAIILLIEGKKGIESIDEIISVDILMQYC